MPECTVEERRRRDREKQRRWRASNKDKSSAYQSAYHAEHKDHKANMRLQSKYGITAEQRDALLSSQSFKCAICSTDAPGGRGTWHVDHCHSSNVVRGLLCSNCNRGLGHFKDDTEILTKAIAYLNDTRRSENSIQRPPQ